MDYEKLLKTARSAAENSYSPYSRFKVGAALLTADGEVFTGCNIENSAFSPCICAERAALASAVSQGYKSFKAIAIYADKNPCFPCGVCRQTLSEFCGDDFDIIVENENGIEACTLKDLLPFAFKL